MEIFLNITAFKLQDEFLFYQIVKRGFKDIWYNIFFIGPGAKVRLVVCMDNNPT